MEDKIQNALLDAIRNRIEELNYQKNQVITRGKNLEKLIDLVNDFENGFDKLREYSREKLENILSPYFLDSTLKEQLNKLEIVRLVFNLQEKGHNVELNDEEIDIMVNFLEKIRSEKNIESQKYEKISLKNIDQLNEEIESLSVIEKKIDFGTKGTEIIISKEIDKIMKLAIEEEANEDVQISILCLLNKMNLSISNNKE